MFGSGVEGVQRAALARMLYFPAREIEHTPADVRLAFEDLSIVTEDRRRLHGWWIPAGPERIGHILFCHGNAGNVGDRVLAAGVLCAAGFDVLLFDYRGYGRSEGRPDEPGTIRDARAARQALLARADVDAQRVFHLGESLGGAVALALSIEQPPAGLVLQSTFSSVRAVARSHYPWIPNALIPDAYPSLELIPRLSAPLLVLHGERDEIVPVQQGRALYDAATVPKRIGVFPDLGHNDLAGAGVRYTGAIRDWVTDLGQR